MYGSTLIIDAFWVDKKPFPTAQPSDFHEGKVFYDFYQGPARYLGWMDLVLLKKVIKKHNINHIILQNLDTLGRIINATKEKKVKVCTAYEHHRLIVNTAPKEKELIHCEPIYTDIEFGGWNFSDNDDEIPGRARLYMEYLLKHTRVDSITCMTNKIKFTVQFDSSGNILSKTEPNL